MFASTTEFTNDQIPGFVGMTWGGHRFTAFANREKAEIAAAKIDCTEGTETKVVERADGKFLVAVIDNFDETFFYADCPAA